MNNLWLADCISDSKRSHMILKLNLLKLTESSIKASSDFYSTSTRESKKTKSLSFKCESKKSKAPTFEIQWMTFWIRRDPRDQRERERLLHRCRNPRVTWPLLNTNDESSGPDPLCFCCCFSSRWSWHHVRFQKEGGRKRTRELGNWGRDNKDVLRVWIFLCFLSIFPSVAGISWDKRSTWLLTGDRAVRDLRRLFSEHHWRKGSTWHQYQN